MDFQWAGVALAVTTFSSIGIGHVLVRQLYARFGTRPGIPLFLLGLLTMFFSLTSERDLLSAVLGVSAITLMWDGLEIYRQKKRMQRKSENPRN